MPIFIFPHVSWIWSHYLFLLQLSNANEQNKITAEEETVLKNSNLNTWKILNFQGKE